MKLGVTATKSLDLTVDGLIYKAPEGEGKQTIQTYDRQPMANVAGTNSQLKGG